MSRTHEQVFHHLNHLLRLIIIIWLSLLDYYSDFLFSGCYPLHQSVHRDSTVKRRWTIIRMREIENNKTCMSYRLNFLNTKSLVDCSSFLWYQQLDQKREKRKRDEERDLPFNLLILLGLFHHKIERERKDSLFLLSPQDMRVNCRARAGTGSCDGIKERSNEKFLQ